MKEIRKEPLFNRRDAIRKFGKIGLASAATLLLGERLQAAEPTPSEIHLDADKVYINGNTWFDSEGRMHINPELNTWGKIQPIPFLESKDSPNVTTYESTGLYFFSFSKNQADKGLFFQLSMPNDWREESNIRAYVNWFPTTNLSASDAVNWKLMAYTNKSGEMIPTSPQTLETNTVTIGNAVNGVYPANQMLTTQFSAEIDMSDMDLSSQIILRLVRADNTYNGYANFVSINLLYLKAGFGSQTEFV